MDRPLCPMYTLPHSQGILYMPGVLNPGTSLVGGMQLDIFLGGMATLLILYLVKIPLSLPYVVWMYGKQAVDVYSLLTIHPNIVSIMSTSSIYWILNSFPLKLATWIVSSEKPSKQRCIVITSTEMGVSTSAETGSHCYTNSSKGGIRGVHYSDPNRTRTCPLPQPVVQLPAQFRSLAFHWLLHQAVRTLSGINTPHIPYPVILHPPAYEDRTDRGFRNVGYQRRDDGELPKRKHITHRTWRKLKIKNISILFCHLKRVEYALHGPYIL